MIPGFDCDDYATAMAIYLENNFAKEMNVTIYMLGVLYRPSPGADFVGHAINVVEYQGKYWFFDPQGGAILGQLSSKDTVEAVTGALIQDLFGAACTDFQYTWIDSRTDFQQKVPGEPQAWYRNSGMRSLFESHCWRNGHDPKLYYPRGVVVLPRNFDLHINPADVFRDFP